MHVDDPLIEVIADKLWRIDGIHVTPDGPDDCHRSNARAVYAAIAATGRLMPAPPPACRCGEPAGPEHCDHCHNDPPRGHKCPRCGAVTLWEVAP